MRKGVAVPTAALTLFAFLAAPAVALACGGAKTAQTETQTAQTLIPTTPTSTTGSAPMTLKPETSTN